MTTPPLNVDLVTAVTQLLPRLTRTEREISLALYRLLADGSPVARGTLAGRAGVPLAEIDAALGSWYGVYCNAAAEVIGYWGLTLQKTGHRLRIDGRMLYTWCAWDTLFLPPILGKAAQAESSCPVSGDSIRLTVAPGGVETVNPRDTVVSLVTPEQAKVKENILLNFCHYVHFFRSPEAGEAWRSKHAGTRLLTVEAAWALGHERNTFQYGDLLDSMNTGENGAGVAIRPAKIHSDSIYTTGSHPGE